MSRATSVSDGCCTRELLPAVVGLEFDVGGGSVAPDGESRLSLDSDCDKRIALCPGSIAEADTGGLGDERRGGISAAKLRIVRSRMRAASRATNARRRLSLVSTKSSSVMRWAGF